MGNVRQIWEAACVAAVAIDIAGLEYPSVHLGALWSEADVAELARLAGVAVKQTSYGVGHLRPRPYVIFSAEAHVGRVAIKAQGARDATAEDAALSMFVDAPLREATADEARAVIEASHV